MNKTATFVSDLKVKPKITDMGRIIQHETIVVDRIPEWIQRLVDNKKNRMAEMQSKCEEIYKSNLQRKQLNAEKTSC